jgi:hypothetical protein
MQKNSSLSTNNKAGQLLNQVAQLRQETTSYQEDEIEQKIRLKVRLNFYSSLKKEDKNWLKTKARLKTYGLTNEEIKVYIQNLEKQIRETKQQLAALT